MESIKGILSRSTGKALTVLAQNPTPTGRDGRNKIKAQAFNFQVLNEPAISLLRIFFNESNSAFVEGVSGNLQRRCLKPVCNSQL